MPRMAGSPTVLGRLSVTPPFACSPPRTVTVTLA